MGHPGVPSSLPDAPWRYGFADRTTLNILHHQPHHGRPIFERLLRTTSIDDVLSFLDEDTSLAQDARMMSTLPRFPFLRAGAAELVVEAASSACRRLAA